jgi:lycopene beta-cyclase
VSAARCHIALLGGGLANTLAALRLKALRPELDIMLVERGRTLGGEHTWSFHETDLTEDQLAWTGPLTDHRWPRQQVRFPAYARTLDIAYRSITSGTLHRVAAERLGRSLFCDADVREADRHGFRLADGRAFQADAVIDARGTAPGDALVLAWQKFIGREVVTDGPHGLDCPVIMDATVSQHDGYRFVYLLPFAPDRILIEDTYYTDDAALDDEALARRIDAYAARRGWRIARAVREERGVLPIALGGDIQALWRAGADGVARAGLAAALFHPTTGYSLPDAVAMADAIAALPAIDGAALFRLTRNRSIATWKRRAGFRFLNRMLFRAARPDQRWRVLERFYRLPEGLIARFYADRLTLADRVRIFTGRPPVPLGRALACIADPMRQAE